MNSIFGKFALMAMFALVSLCMTSTASAQFCDMNLDGKCDIDDQDLLCFVISYGYDANVFPWMDLDGDGGDIDPADMAAWRANYSAHVGWAQPVSPGDGNLDGAVDASDFNIWNSNKFTFQRYTSKGDYNCDGAVDVSDYDIWNNHKFTIQR